MNYHMRTTILAVVVELLTGVAGQFILMCCPASVIIGVPLLSRTGLASPLPKTQGN
jgi:hypothetical protein